MDFLGNNDQDGGCITEVEKGGGKRRSGSSGGGTGGTGGGGGGTGTGGGSGGGSGGRNETSGTNQARRPKHPAYFIPELAHVVALCDERIPFVTLAQEVGKKIKQNQILFIIHNKERKKNNEKKKETSF